MKARSFFLSIALLATLPLSALADDAGWKAHQKAGQTSATRSEYNEAMKEYSQALQLLADSDASERDEKLQSLMFYDISDCIENLSLNSDLDNARKLAKQKLDVAKQRFGLKSEFALDAMQDELFVFNQSHDEAGANTRFWQYVQTARGMRSDGEGDKVDEAQIIRRDRLQKKLNETIAKLKKQTI